MNGSNDSPSITVFSQSEHVGTLVFNEPGKCSFTYDDEWVSNRFPLSPCIPFNDQIEPETITRFLRNLFPEGDAFDLLLESRNLSRNNLYAILKTIGKDTAGALSFFDTEIQQEETQLRLISEQELIDKLATGSTRELVTWDGKYRLSVAGLQKKLNVYIDEQDQLLLADGDFSSTHILKFSSQKTRTIVINELFCMRLASELTSTTGFKVAYVSFRRFGVHDTLIVERFDRKRASKSVKKRHIIDGCQALDLPPEYKYENNFGTGRDVKHIRDGVSFKKLFSFARICSVPAMVIQQLLDWLIFNIIIGNSDAHGKNISFFVSGSGITITPFYDLVSVAFEASRNNNIDTSLAMAVGDNFDIDTITAFDLLSFADESNISFRLLKKRILLIAGIVLNKVGSLQFYDFEINKEQAETIEELKRLVVRRANKLLDQSNQIDMVINTAF
jgi:serine/threonine-protein kinase HipA